MVAKTYGRAESAKSKRGNNLNFTSVARTKVKPAKTIFFRLSGESIKPHVFSAREIATIIQNLEEACRSVAKNEKPQLDESTLFISLVEIRDESAGLKFVPSYSEVSAAFILLASSFSNGDFDRIPPRAINNLKEIQKVISHKPGCVGTFFSGRTRLSTIDKDTEIEIPTTGIIEGETTLYGQIRRVGGSDPKIIFRLHNGDNLSLEVSESTAKSFGPRLYEEVGIKGIARWSYADNKILSFSVEQLINFKDTPVSIAFDELRGSIGKYWDEIEDVEEALK
jgi:hypothetical protein